MGLLISIISIVFSAVALTFVFLCMRAYRKSLDLLKVKNFKASEDMYKLSFRFRVCATVFSCVTIMCSAALAILEVVV